MVRVLGIDPGFDRTGWGVIDQTGGNPTWVAHGCITTPKSSEFSDRLKLMRDELEKVIDTYAPQCVAVEELFFSTNAKTAIKVGMARGVIILTVADAGLRVVDITPNQVKQGITGWGSADKKQVQTMVQRILHLTDVPKPDDAADALAIAVVGGTVSTQPK